MALAPPPMQNYPQGQNYPPGQIYPPNYNHLPPPYKPQLWKLFRGKYVLVYYLCDQCQDRLYHSKDRITENEEGCVMKIELCHSCIEKNCKATTALTKPYVPKNQEQEH